MLRPSFIIAALAVTLAWQPPAHAVITYDEAVSGDIDTFTAAVDALGQPTRTFLALGVGHNTFTGTLASGGPQDSSDVIPFEVLANQRLDSLTVSVFDSLIIQGSQIALDSLYTNTEPVNVPLANYTTSLALGPGLYTLLLGNGVVVTGYQVALDVSQVSTVPEPDSWTLLVAGLGLAGAALRRQTARQAKTA